MNFQHVENLLIRFRGQAVDIKTMSGGVYEGTITDVTNDYVGHEGEDRRRGNGRSYRFAAQHRVRFASQPGLVL